LLAFFVLSLAAGCSRSTPRRDDLAAPPLNLDNSRLALGHQVFLANCNECHPGGAGGEGPALNNRRLLLGRVIKFQVRHGVGAMPKFSRRRISDQELSALVVYIEALHEERPTLAQR
jgi:mono/diheme cytochrome c family protein